MIHIYRRPISKEDIKAITKGRGSPLRNILTVAVPVGALLFAGIYLIVGSIALALAVAVAFVFASTWSNTRYFKDVKKRKESKDDQSAVEVMELEATRVFDIEHLGSHGPAYCFFTDDGRALLLVGQWLMGFSKFPSLSFRLFRWADDGKPIRIEVTGKKVKPEHSTVALHHNYSNGDVELFRAQPDTLQQDLENAFGSGTDVE